MFTDEANFFPSILVGDVCGGKKINLKTVAPRNGICYAVRHYWLRWCLLWLFYWLERHPLRRFDQVPLSEWDQWGICDPYAGVVNQDFVLMDGNALPCRACFVTEYTECERNRMHGLAWSSPYVNLTRACMVQTPKTLLGQLYYRCGMTSQTSSFRIGQECVLLQSENWLAASLVCVRLFLTLEVARFFICLTLCVTWNMLLCCL